MAKKVSIIIPAYNEEKFIEKTLKAYKAQRYLPLEIVVVVNNSTDKTFKIAQKYTDKVLNLGKIGVSAARNEGVKVSDGEVLIFSDADSRISVGGIKKIANATKENTIGTILGKGDNNSFRGRLFFFYKNWVHRLGIYSGVIDGVFFCHKNIFKKAEGFNPKRKIAEFDDFIERARRRGASYRVLTNCRAITSLRRYERNGYFKTLLFWVRYTALSVCKKGKDLEDKYFEE